MQEQTRTQNKSAHMALGGVVDFSVNLQILNTKAGKNMISMERADDFDGGSDGCHGLTDKATVRVDDLDSTVPRIADLAT